MRWPASTPPLIITLPGMRPPTSTSAFSTLSSSLTRHTKVSLPICCTAISGTTSACRVLRATVTSTSMPGLRTRSGLGKSPRTVAEREPASSRADTVATVPSKVRPAYAPAVPLKACPGAMPASSVSGTGKSTNTRETSSSVAIAVPGVTSAPGLTWRMPSTPANGARITRSERLARICATCARAASRVARCASSDARATSCCDANCACRW